MKGSHAALAVLVAAIWGLNFVVVELGLGHFPPLLLAALRFAVAAVPVVALPRPKMAWGRMVTIASVLFLGQFALLFTGMAAGMPAGLASVITQAQAIFTILLAALILGERPSRTQLVGALVSFAGLAAILGALGDGVTAAGAALTLAAALSWGFGNVLLRQSGRVDMLPCVVWMSLIPPVPLLGLSLLLDGPANITQALSTIGWSGIATVSYLAGVSTVVGYGIWGMLLKTYPASTVAPFSLLVPVFGMGFASLILGERIGPNVRVGAVLVLVGLALNAWSARSSALTGAPAARSRFAGPLGGRSNTLSPSSPFHGESTR